MTLKNALLVTAVRFLGLVICLMLLFVPARILRAVFFQDGLSSDAVMIIVIVLLVSSTVIFFTYVLAPVFKWWDRYEEESRTRVRRYLD